MTVSRTPDRFVHAAAFYRDDPEYLARLVPFVVDGLARDEPVAVAVPGERLVLLSDALGAQASLVRMLDITEAGRNPGRIIPGVLHEFADRYPDRHVRIVGEPIWAGRSDREYPACVQHEALINLAFTGRNVTIVCPYDAKRLAPHVLADAYATHPVVLTSNACESSARYAPELVIETYNQPLPAPDDSPQWTVRMAADLAVARRLASARAEELGLTHERGDDLALMVNELATNSLVHSGGECVVRVWREYDEVVCAVTDRGHVTDPLAGRRPSVPGQFGGRGLLLVNHFADLVRLYTTAEGTTVHVHCRLDEPRESHAR